METGHGYAYDTCLLETNGMCYLVNFYNLCSEAIKQRMERDVDEVLKIAWSIKSKIEELDKDVR